MTLSKEMFVLSLFEKYLTFLFNQRQPLSAVLFAMLTVSFLSSCSLQEKTPETAAAFYKKALLEKEQNRYPKALETLNGMRKQFPYSSYNRKARLLLADIYFEQKKYLLAAEVYKRYLQIYPHTETAYVLNQLGLCHLHKLPSTPDRDISEAEEALFYFQKLLSLPEKHSYIKEAKKHKTFLLDLKAKKEFITASFYIKKGWLKGAFQRLVQLIENYPESSVISDTLLSALDLAKKLNQNPKPFEKQLKQKFPHLLKSNT